MDDPTTSLTEHVLSLDIYDSSSSLPASIPRHPTTDLHNTLSSNYASFIDLLVRNNIPVIPGTNLQLLSPRLLGRGGSFTVLTGLLKEPLDPQEFTVASWSSSASDEAVFPA